LQINKAIKNLTFRGESDKKGDFYFLQGKITGFVEVECVKCLKTYKKEVNEDIKLKIVKPPYNGFDEEWDIIEQEKFDLNEILTSEIESYKLDYNVCENCKNIEFNKEF